MFLEKEMRRIGQIGRGKVSGKIKMTIGPRLTSSVRHIHAPDRRWSTVAAAIAERSLPELINEPDHNGPTRSSMSRY